MPVVATGRWVMKLVSAIAIAILTLGSGLARAQGRVVQTSGFVQFGAAPVYSAPQPYAYPGSYYPRAGVTFGSPSFSFGFGITPYGVSPSVGIQYGYGGYPGYYGGYPGTYGGYGTYAPYPGYYGYPAYSYPRSYYPAYPRYYGGHPGYTRGYGHYPGHGYSGYGWRGHSGRW